MKRHIHIHIIYFVALCSFLLTGSIQLFASGKAQRPAEHYPDTVRIAALNGSSAIPMAYLFEHSPVLKGMGTAQVPTHFEVAASADVLLPKLLKGEIDIGILPPNVAAKVFTSNNGAIVVGAVVGNGMLNLITDDSHIQTLADLNGKTIYVAGRGATPEYILRFLLQSAGVEATLDFSIPAAELPAALLSGKIQYAFMPEPFATLVTSKNPSMRRALDIQSLFATASGTSSEYPMTVVVIRKQFAESYPDLVRSFLEAYKYAITWTNEHPDEAGVLTEKHTLGLNAQIAAQAIPYAHFVFIEAQTAQNDIERLLNLFLQYAPQSIGGVLPSQAFYFK